MTVRQAAILLKRSPSTLYRWLRKGHMTPFEQAGLAVSRKGRRWIIEEKPMSEQKQEWPSYIHRGYAEQDGLTPDDLRFEQWPLSDIHLRHVATDEHYPEDIALVYSCQIPSETPHCNQYDQNGNPLPDPVGIALQSIRFELQNADTGEALDEDNRDHDNGNVIGFLAGRSPIWHRLTPGTSLHVRLIAYPLFYYINQDGAAVLAYAIGNNQHFRGPPSKATSTRSR